MIQDLLDMEMEDIVGLGYQCSLSDSNELLKCLTLLHEWGVLLHFNTETLTNFVILNPGLYLL